jgi:hypothetical protein
MAYLSMSWESNVWYTVECARTGRSTCKEFQCKKPIAQGEVRIGIETEESDHAGSLLGWYHPDCLRRTFLYKKNANKPIDDIALVKGFSQLAVKSQDQLKAQFASGAPLSQPTTAATDGPLKGRLSLAKGEGDSIFVGGATFAVKDELRKAGGTWDGAKKSWKFDDAIKLREWLRIALDALLPTSFDLSTLSSPAAEAEQEEGSPKRKAHRTEK